MMIQERVCSFDHWFAGNPLRYFLLLVLLALGGGCTPASTFHEDIRISGPRYGGVEVDTSQMPGKLQPYDVDRKKKGWLFVTHTTIIKKYRVGRPVRIVLVPIDPEERTR
jgi:hypothetical protein